MDGNVEGDKRETTRPIGLVIRVAISGVGLLTLLWLGQLLG